jgi:hypothetical protein
MKKIGENIICKNDVECKNKGTENFCFRYPNLDVDYGVCANSISEANNLSFKIFTKDCLKMPTLSA